MEPYISGHIILITNNLYTSDDYATYNLLGVGYNAASSGVSTSKPDGNIASGQSFVTV
jgi:hypothetical protein